ncbi:MAG: Rossmann-like and DUF2520 domain-containing protein [Actinomycetota bacterium]
MSGVDIAIVGSGRVGTALGILWQAAEHDVVAASGSERTDRRVREHLPETEFLSSREAAARGEVVVIGVPDDAIGSVCGEIAGSLRVGQIVLHLSGSVPLDALASARDAGAETLSLHPLQTFPSVEAGVERMPGAPVAITATDPRVAEVGSRLAEDAGGKPFPLDDEMKPLYHAAAVFTSNFMVTALAAARELFDAAGVPDGVQAMTPLANATLHNALTSDPISVLTGPAVRGDVGTVQRNLHALHDRAPELVASYVVLSEAALALVGRSDRDPPASEDAVREVLAQWR